MKPTASSFQVSRKNTLRESSTDRHPQKISSSFFETVSSFSFSSQLETLLQSSRNTKCCNHQSQLLQDPARVAQNDSVVVQTTNPKGFRRQDQWRLEATRVRRCRPESSYKVHNQLEMLSEKWIYFHFFYILEFIFKNFLLQHFHGEDSRKAVIFLINDWIYFSCCSKKELQSFFLYVSVKHLPTQKLMQ
jgi:hypothetical protein